MPIAPLTHCHQPGCPEKVKSGYCAMHRRQVDLARGTAQQRGYDHDWAKFSKVWRTRHPLCGERADGRLYAQDSRCVQQGIDTAANATDHIVSMKNGGSKYGEENLQSLCLSCNSRKRNLVDGPNAGKGDRR